jgi:hypothetical protein
MLDAYSLMTGHVGQQNNGAQAVTQATQGTGPDNIITGARLPKELQPTSFDKFRDPAVIVRKAMYGHPEAQGHWERHL